MILKIFYPGPMNRFSLNNNCLSLYELFNELSKGAYLWALLRPNNHAGSRCMRVNFSIFIFYAAFPNA